MSFFWHDYETWGANPMVDRASQFAGVRTDMDFNIVGDPLTLYCQPAEDVLPSPEACLITGITPQKALQEGVCEAEFISRIHAEMAVPGTCSLGYNSLRFDDEVTRQTLYRNFYDPYAREWKEGNSRWDLIDVVRLAYALRPEGIEWPTGEDGAVSFRLELLSRANGIEHGAAHDAMSDVHATIGLAKLLKSKQPRLFDYSFRHRGKRQAAQLLDVNSQKPVFHVSSKFPVALGCCALVAPLAVHPTNPNGIIVYDLRVDPGSWVDLSAEEIKELVFVSTADLPEGRERIPLKTVHINKCPVLVESKILKTMDAARRAEFKLDGDTLRKHLAVLRESEGLAEKLSAVFTPEEPTDDEAPNPDLMLYSGGFFSNDDRQKMEMIRLQSPDMLAELKLQFSDPRIPEMLFRYRARNFPETLTEPEMERWQSLRQAMLSDGMAGGITLSEYFNRIQELASQSTLTAREKDVLQELKLYGEMVYPYY